MIIKELHGYSDSKVLLLNENNIKKIDDNKKIINQNGEIDLDDSSLYKHLFYPKDIVLWARNQTKIKALNSKNNTATTLNG